MQLVESAIYLDIFFMGFFILIYNITRPKSREEEGVVIFRSLIAALTMVALFRITQKFF